MSEPRSGLKLTPELDNRDRGRLLLALTPLVPVLALVPGGRWLLPFVAPLTVYVWFARRVRFGDYFGAWKLGMLWAGLLSLGVIVLTYLLPEATGEGILHGVPYREEMFGWIETGVGKENTPSQFVPEHMLHLGLFQFLTWISGGYLGLTLGAALVAYMSYFVGSYGGAGEVMSAQWLLGPVVAWVPWSILRVAAFVLLGAVFSRPLLARRKWTFHRPERSLIVLALTGIAGDLLIKTFLAPAYGRFLRQLAGW